MSINENLSAVSELRIKDKNFVNHYLTFRQKRSERNTDPDTHSVGGQLLSVGLGQSLAAGQNLEKFVVACRQRLSKKVEDPEFSDLLEEMYFADGARGLFEVSPEFMLFKCSSCNSGHTKHVGEVLSGLLAATGTEIRIASNNVNFLEREIVDEFQSAVTNATPNKAIENYLPFLADTFSRDLQLLSQYPSYLMQSLKAFIALYNFLYSAQLALNLNTWKSKPTSKPLFFILDTERASVERKQVREAVSQLKDKVADLFPVLSALEYLNQPDSKTANRYPIWVIYDHLVRLDSSDQQLLVAKLSEFLANYREKRDHAPWPNTITTPSEALEAITTTAKEIFGQAKTSQQRVKTRVVEAFTDEVARHFIQNRRRGGNVLILNQDYLLLLTNLAVGFETRIQFQQLIEEFKSRGIWLDQQSQQALIEFYDRVGNLERMSDSGDAVYVRKTI